MIEPQKKKLFVKKKEFKGEKGDKAFKYPSPL